MENCEQVVFKIQISLIVLSMSVNILFANIAEIVVSLCQPFIPVNC